MQLKKQEKRNKLQIVTAALLGEGAALLCAFFYRSITRGSFLGTLLVFGFFSVVTVGTVKDLSCRKIPDGICGLIMGITGAAVFWMSEISLAERIVGGTGIGGLMLAAALLFSRVFGGGDIKLMAACGGFLGWKMIREAFVTAMIAASLEAFLLLAKGKSRKTGIAMAPFFELGMIFSFLKYMIKISY